MEISISRALTELKTLDARIATKINSASFIATVKNSSTKISNVYTKEEFDTLAKASYESIIDLIERRRIIKSLIVKSNAETVVVIGGGEYSVANAIERKTSIELSKALLRTMEGQYRTILAQTNKFNDTVEANLIKLLETSMGSDKKDSADATVFSDAYRKNNGYDIVNPLKLQDKIEVLKKEIEDFEEDCDSSLSEINAITKIDVPS